MNTASSTLKVSDWKPGVSMSSLVIHPSVLLRASQVAAEYIKEVSKRGNIPPITIKVDICVEVTGGLPLLEVSDPDAGPDMYKGTEPPFTIWSQTPPGEPKPPHKD